MVSLPDRILSFLSLTIALHFNSEEHTYQHLKVIPIEILDPNSDLSEHRKSREPHWQRTLDTIYPQGLNNYPIDPHTPNLYLNNNPPPNNLFLSFYLFVIIPCPFFRDGAESVWQIMGYATTDL